jgi:hypothetical protein
VQRLANWEGREYRKGKENEKDVKREKERKEDVVSKYLCPPKIM